MPCSPWSECDDVSDCLLCSRCLLSASVSSSEPFAKSSCKVVNCWSGDPLFKMPFLTPRCFLLNIQIFVDASEKWKPLMSEKAASWVGTWMLFWPFGVAAFGQKRHLRMLVNANIWEHGVQKIGTFPLPASSFWQKTIGWEVLAWMMTVYWACRWCSKPSCIDGWQVFVCVSALIINTNETQSKWKQHRPSLTTLISIMKRRLGFFKINKPLLGNSVIWALFLLCSYLFLCKWSSHMSIIELVLFSNVCCRWVHNSRRRILDTPSLQALPSPRLVYGKLTRVVSNDPVGPFPSRAGH